MDNSEVSNTLICSICLDSIDSSSLYKTRCNHCYHENCINRSLLSNPRCPYCRTVLNNETNTYNELFNNWIDENSQLDDYIFENEEQIIIDYLEWLLGNTIDYNNIFDTFNSPIDIDFIEYLNNNESQYVNSI